MYFFSLDFVQCMLQMLVVLDVLQVVIWWYVQYYVMEEKT